MTSFKSKTKKAASVSDSGDEGGAFIEEAVFPLKNLDLPDLVDAVDVSDDDDSLDEFDEIHQVSIAGAKVHIRSLGGEDLPGARLHKRSFGGEDLSRDDFMSGEDLSAAGGDGDGGGNIDAIDEINEYREVVEELFVTIDEDGDGFTFDQDIDIMKKRLKSFPKQRFAPLIGWIRRMPTRTVRNLSEQQFVEYVEKALREHFPGNEKEAIETITSLIGTLREAKMREKRSPRLSLSVAPAKRRPDIRISDVKREAARSSTVDFQAILKRSLTESKRKREEDVYVQNEMHQSNGWRRAKFDLPDTKICDNPWPERFTHTEPIVIHRLPRALGPIDIGRIHSADGWKPAKYPKIW